MTGRSILLAVLAAAAALVLMAGLYAVLDVLPLAGMLGLTAYYAVRGSPDAGRRGP